MEKVQAERKEAVLWVGRSPEQRKEDQRERLAGSQLGGLKKREVG